MSQPVKLSDALVLDARLAGEAFQRSITSQVEFWARLGRAVEPLLDGAHVVALSRTGAVQPISSCIESVDTAAGRRRVADYLASRPFPHYEAAPDAPGLLVRIEADGKRLLGRFVNRQFRTVKRPSRPKPVKAVPRKSPKR